MYRFAYTFELHLLASKSTSILFPTPSNPNPTLICSSLSLSPPPHATHLSIRAQLKQHIMLIPIGPPNTRTRKRAVPTNSSRSPNTPLPPPLRNNNRIARRFDLEVETRGSRDAGRGYGVAAALLDRACDAAADGEESDVYVVGH